MFVCGIIELGLSTTFGGSIFKGYCERFCRNDCGKIDDCLDDGVPNLFAELYGCETACVRRGVVMDTTIPIKLYFCECASTLFLVYSPPLFSVENFADFVRTEQYKVCPDYSLNEAEFFVFGVLCFWRSLNVEQRDHLTASLQLCTRMFSYMYFPSTCRSMGDGL